MQKATTWRQVVTTFKYHMDMGEDSSNSRPEMKGIKEFPTLHPITNTEPAEPCDKKWNQFACDYEKEQILFSVTQVLEN